MRLLTALCSYGLLVATARAAGLGQCLNDIFFGMDGDHKRRLGPTAELLPRAEDDDDALEIVISAGSGMINLSSLLAGGTVPMLLHRESHRRQPLRRRQDNHQRHLHRKHPNRTGAAQQPNASEIGINWSASASTQPNTRYTCTSQFIDFSKDDSLKYFDQEWCPQNAYQTGDTVTWRLTEECGTTMVYPWDFHYGRIEGQIRIGAGSGVVTTMLLMGPAPADEIDFEWVGKDVNSVQTTFYVQSQRHRSDLSKSFHNYTIELTENSVKWYVDGKLADSWDKTNRPFPTEASRMRMGIWDGTQTSGWAGPIDWSNGPFTAEIRSFNFIPYC
ncbi:concanavalin A-like lectin/glucanase [Linderina pennispora]|uniref:Concanavalin A-like lectin/glucanase n=1 Tax=Linderina pennispora TaxID=61395 RepID=A0A1Y1WK12_9FUNG|nr:concanavalin A-like lectin/glucanase [Linderina pennispora]ORX73556.1 concanavalin A-like lectin/glucanase [Linderina pennispora]